MSWYFVLALVVIGLIVYLQIGWLIVSRLQKSGPKWSGEGNIGGTILWPFVALWCFVVLPLLEGFLWAIRAPQEWFEGRSKRRKQRESLAQQAREASAKQTASPPVETATSPAAEIGRIEAEMAKLAARKLELQRRPDAARH